MTDLLALIEKGKKQLDENLLSIRLADSQITVDAKLHCIPYLSFFVLGFKDCMNLLYTHEPRHELEKVVNTHCEEDSFHWKWFLQDLDILNVDGIYNKKPTEVLMELWSDERKPIREAVYAITGYIQEYTSPALRMILIEVVESGYAAFTQYMSPVIQKAGLYDQLLYFGHTHNDAESQHEFYQHAEDISLERIIEGLSPDETQKAQEMIQNIFGRINVMHECFAKAIALEFSS